MLQWARAHGCEWSAATCSAAAMGGHLEVLQWARAHGCEWNGDTCSAAVAAGEDLAETEAAAVMGGKSRACALFGTLGRLYERSHLLLAASTELSAIRDVLASLLMPFGWLQPVLLRLVDSHHLRDVEAEEIANAFAVLIAIPEGVPPAQLDGMAELEPEPEPES